MVTAKSELERIFPSSNVTEQGEETKVNVKELSKPELTNLAALGHNVRVKRSGTGLTVILS